jgi:hypothetical protein
MYSDIYAQTDEEFYESLIYYGTGLFDIELIAFTKSSGTLFDLESTRSFMSASGYSSLVLSSNNDIKYDTSYCVDTGLTVYFPVNEMGAWLC